MEKKKIIFVDDEPKVLQGLKRLLYFKKSEWVIDFAFSGLEALQKMKEQHYDLIVTDMRMPNMDGAQLLKIVMHEYPQTSRFVLSGNSNSDLILKSLAPTDLFLAKPCKAEDLIDAIENVFQAEESININKAKAIISSLKKIPSLPEVYSQLKHKLDSPHSSIKEIAAVISMDIGISAKVLQMVNSSYFALRRRIESVQEGVVYLGLETVKGIVLTEKLFTTFRDDVVQKYEVKELYKHGLFVGLLAGEIAKTLTHKQELINEAVMAGILHDIGRIILIHYDESSYETMYKVYSEEEEILCKLEIKKYGISHPQLGGYVLKTWGLTPSIIEAVSCHVNPLLAKNRGITAQTAVYIANSLDNQHSVEIPLDYNPLLECPYLKLLGIVDKMQLWETIYKQKKSYKDSLLNF